MSDHAASALSKVPAVTLSFWIIKILATTLGETGGDAVSMSWLGQTTPGAGSNGINGYLVGTAIFGVLLIALAWLQIRARRFNPWLYWATIIASTTAGTTLADYATRSIGLGYSGGSLLLFSLVLLSLFTWHRALGNVDVDGIDDARAETFYWITVTFSQTLGTALGDWVADGSLGYSGAALLFGAAMAILSALYLSTQLSRILLFWSAFILTRPLGATVGDFLDKPIAKGGLELSRSLATAVLAAAIVLMILIIPQRPGGHPKAAEKPSSP
jgi:uncharacterized membrane-anchored protein